jgi:hypothetical protein
LKIYLNTFLMVIPLLAHFSSKDRVAIDCINPNKGEDDDAAPEREAMSRRLIWGPLLQKQLNLLPGTVFLQILEHFLKSRALGSQFSILPRKLSHLVQSLLGDLCYFPWSWGTLISTLA